MTRIHDAKTRITGVLFIFAFLVIAISACATKSNLTFLVDGAVTDMDPYTSPQQGILSQAWNTSDTLRVEAYVKEFCGGVTFRGDYRLEGNNLILLYGVKYGDAVTSCKGVYRLVYTISHLEQKDYILSIVLAG